MAESVGELLARILRKRGISSEEAMRSFLDPRLDSLASPDSLPGVAEAAAAILAAVRERKRIVVFGDYDCDGVSATAIMVKVLQALGADVTSFIPARLSEGYGMSESSVSRMLAENPAVGLVVTVDNGINSVAEVSSLAARGIDVVITDHHLPTLDDKGEAVLPEARSVVNPKVAAPPELENICGAAVAYFLSAKLVELAKREGLYNGSRIGGELVVLAGLATVTDVMPLVGQNRILVSGALRHFGSWAPIGLRKLLERAARKGASTLTSRDFGFLIGPRINAAGRMANGNAALELMLSDDQDIANEGSRIVEGYNSDRKEAETKMLEFAMSKTVPGAAAQVLDIPDGHQGVAGIVAARVMDKLEPQVPTCVVVGLHGSARAPQGYNLRDALNASSEFLTRFGGHALAAGFSVKEGGIDEFRKRFAAACEEQRSALPTTDAVKIAGYEFDVEPNELTVASVGELVRLEPYGEGNPEPVFCMRAVTLKELRTIGADNKHLSLMVNGHRAVWWFAGDRVNDLRARSTEPHDVYFKAAVSDYGESHVELRIVAILPGN